MSTVAVSSKGWVVIPAEYRRKYDVQPGSEIEVVDFGGGLSLIPLFRNPIQEAFGMLKSRKRLTTALLTDRKTEGAREALR